MASGMPRVRFQRDEKSNCQKKKCGRVKVAEYDTAALYNSLERYIKSVGVNQAFDLHSYKSLPVSFAARGNCLVKMHRWVTAILAVNPQGRFLVSHWFVFVFFPERRFVAGFFRRLLAYLTPHISHTYPAHFTYPTHIHFKRIHHTYPTHIQHIAHIPHISIPNVSHTYVSHQYVSMQCVSIQKVVIRIPPITTNIPYISSTSYISHTYPFQTYPFQTYPTNTCPLQTYPFKRCASAGIANVSHQDISHRYVSSTRIPPVRIHSMRIHSKSLHQQEWLWVWASLHIISYHSYHCYSAGMVMNIKTLLFLQFFAKLLIDYNFIARVWTWNSLLAIGLSACLPVVCFCACFLIIFYYSIPPGGMGRVNRKATLSLKTRRRSPKTVAKRKFHLLAVNPLAKNASSIAQNCSETQISFARGEPSR